MNKIILLMLFSIGVFAQTSEYRTSFYNKTTNAKLSGYSGYIYLVPQANTYPSGAITLLAVSGYDDYYYASAVPDGEYKIYIDLDKGGAGVPVLYREKVYIGENRLTTMANQFYSGMTDETEKLELNKYSDLEKAAVSPFQQKISENFEKVDSAVKYFDPRFFEVVGDEVTLNTTLYDSTLIPVVDTVINNDSTVSTSGAIVDYVKKSVDSLNTLNKLTNVAYKGQNNNFTTSQTVTGGVTVTNTFASQLVDGTNLATPSIRFRNSGSGLNSVIEHPGQAEGQTVYFRGGNSTKSAKLYIADANTTSVTIGSATIFTGFNIATPSEVVEVGGNIKASGTITGTNHIAGSANYFYLGDPTTDGSWRIGRSGNNLVSERRESGTWVTKQTITP